MFDHIGYAVGDVEKSKKFYEAALQPFGITAKMGEEGQYWGFGQGADMPKFWINKGEGAGKSTHVAFAAVNRAQVDAFYKAALAAGAKDNGAPGLRTLYHENYYGAFVLDPDGNNVEAVTHKPE